MTEASIGFSRFERSARAARPASDRARLPLAVQLLCLATIFGYAIFFQFTRAFGIAGLGAAVAASALLWLPIARWYRVQILWMLAGLAAIYVIVSVLGLLHWDTLMFQPSAIPQQAAYAFLLPILVPVFAYYHERVFMCDRPFVVFDNWLILVALVSKLLTPDGVSLGGLAVIQFFNVEAIFLFLVVRRLFYIWSDLPLLRFVAVALIAVTAGSFQSQIVTVALAGLVIAPRFSRLILGGLVVSMLVAAIAATPFADEIWQLDPNTGIRLFFWQDAIERIVSSYGVGQGFGTETIRPVYVLSSYDVAIASVESDDFILVGAHNAFIDTAYRMGLLGGALAVALYAHLLLNTMQFSGPSRTFDYFVCALLFVLLMVNVGLASINFLIGAAFLIGWLTFRIATHFPSPDVSNALSAMAKRPASG